MAKLLYSSAYCEMVRLLLWRLYRIGSAHQAVTVLMIISTFTLYFLEIP